MSILEQPALDALIAPLDAKHVKHRQQAGQKLSYIEAWHAIAEANRIFGFDRWSREIVEMRCVWEGTIKTRNGERDACSYVATVRVSVFDPESGCAVIRHGTGAGHGMGSHPGEAHESAVKEAESDAMKRGLMTFGWPFGLALYDKAQSHVESTGGAKQPHDAPAHPPPGTAPLDDVPDEPLPPAEDKPKLQRGEAKPQTVEERARALWKEISKAQSYDELLELDVREGDFIDSLPDDIRTPLTKHFEQRAAKLKETAA